MDDENLHKESDAVFEALGTVLLEELKKKDQENLEIFDRYAHLLKLKMLTKDASFIKHLVKGYQVLLEDLKKAH